MHSFLDTPIEFLKGVGPARAEHLKKELGISTYNDLLEYYPFRYDDRSKIYSIREVSEDFVHIQLKGKIVSVNTLGSKYKKRMVAVLSDSTGQIELVWFKGINWIAKKLVPGVEYIVFGRPSKFGSKYNIAHPEIDPVTGESDYLPHLQPVYSTTEKLKAKFIDSKTITKFQKTLLPQVLSKISETLPPDITEEFKLAPKAFAYQNIHIPQSEDALKKARYRLKFEELYYIQLKLLSLKDLHASSFKGKIFNDTKVLTEFYQSHLPFPLTNAQKRVIREIYTDMKSGSQMNRLLQGDVGSGKTIVAFICMLLVVGSGDQAALMAPTETLTIQHYNSLKTYCDKMGIRIALLTGSTKASEKKLIRAMLKEGDLQVVVGTHALLEDKVQFQNLGLAIVDEQHRFGVAQRSKLWQKNKDIYPHVLVMTATPIPRTLAMTLYGDLDVSVIDEMPAGRKPIQTVHRYDANRLKVNGFIREEIDKGRQIYIVYPLIEESEKLDLKDLMDGYESICRAFPDIHVSIVNGKMKSEDKEWEMQRFKKGETRIMVATTVIEVGVDVPNASVMVIENAERFGLAQLHQLRGRVGRGAEQSYCILMSKFELSREARLRIETMVKTNNGFEIADTDLKLRGPGDLTGTQQSGVPGLKIADLAKDGNIVKIARSAAYLTLNKEGGLNNPTNALVKLRMDQLKDTLVDWGNIS